MLKAPPPTRLRTESLLTWVNDDLIYTCPVFSFLIRNMKERCCGKEGAKTPQIAPTFPIWTGLRFGILFFLLGTTAVVMSGQITQLCIY